MTSTEGLMNGGAQRRAANSDPERRLSPSVAHDLNNPLDAVGNLLYLIEAEPNLTESGRLAVFPQQLGRAFSNLLLNAADAISPSGRIHLRVHRAREWSGKARRGLRVTFADNGSGITRHDLHNILLPFYSTKGGDGNGMGLAIVKDVVNHHGGVLRVRSTTRAGRSGSVFAIFLPAA